jgi:hypothetical protein
MKKFKSWINENMSIGSVPVRGMGYVSGGGDGDSPSYLDNNIADADNRNNVLKLVAKQHADLHKSTKVTKGK